MAPRHDRAGVTRALANVSHAFSILIAAIAFALPGTATAGEVPTFAVDSSWPKPLPNNWILGQVGGITVDWQGHIWVIHRPRSLTDDEKGASLNPPRSKCCVSAPPVLEFDTDGNLLRSWGGAGEGYEWVGREHGIEVDERGFVWVGGNADNDNAILKFTLDGKFVAQIGKIAPSLGSNDTTQLGKPAETAIDKEANEIYVADGYGNRRVIVFDAKPPSPTSGTGAPTATSPMTPSRRRMIPRRQCPSSSATPSIA
ncbi:DNA-binding beta-propeller fold protein YncE [Bradyrhizobium sp. LM3.6]